ncbi:MAG: T9SS type A sorting domain-containing protein, partial [Bacteroidetes bacterium]|nr:T9SS type A sorting domain-containing protein [Bacteroidota bacterium]
IAFYSKKDGGRVLKSALADQNGLAQLNESQDFYPAFALNTKDKNEQGIAGSGMVTFTGDKEFIMKNLAISEHNGSNTLSWNASFVHPENYSFQLLKSINGSKDIVVGSVNAQSQEMSNYSLTDLNNGADHVTYRIRVMDKQNEVNYLSDKFYPGAVNSLVVYPTVVQSSLNVSIKSGISNADISFQITNVQGQVMQSGKLNNLNSNIPVSNLPAGNYLITCFLNGNSINAKFVKN